MKKYVGLLFVSLMMSHAALADTTIPWTKEGCESVKGTWITAHSPTDAGCDAAHCNGKNFCRSNVNVNWFNAFIWCKAIGHQVVSFSNLCPGITTAPSSSISTGPCANAKNTNINYSWTDIPWGNTEALTVLNSGAIYVNSRSNGSGYYALCEE